MQLQGGTFQVCASEDFIRLSPRRFGHTELFELYVALYDGVNEYLEALLAKDLVVTWHVSESPACGLGMHGAEANGFDIVVSGKRAGKMFCDALNIF